MNKRMELDEVLNSTELPDNMEWYEIDGHKIFEIRAPTGTDSNANLMPTGDVICYLANRGTEYNKDWFRYGIRVKQTITFHKFVIEIQKAIKSFQEHLANNTAKVADIDGGELGTGDNIEP